jgi:hypothetical protein
VSNNNCLNEAPRNENRPPFDYGLAGYINRASIVTASEFNLPSAWQWVRNSVPRILTSR